VSDSSLSSSGKIKTPIVFNGKIAEEIGFDKIRAQQAALQELRVAVVDGLCVAGLDPTPLPWTESLTWPQSATVLRETCPNVRELDLSRSLLERWADVVGICACLPELRRLVLK
jgi:tubulin-specific chaperone E